MISEIIHKFKKNKSALWLEKGVLKASVFETIRDEVTKAELKEQKQDLIDFLTKNNILSEEIFCATKIFKDLNATAHPLSFAQERLWFIEQYEQGTNAYHVPVLLELQAGVDKEKLKYAIQQVVYRHEILRTIFKHEKEQYYQVVIDGALKINEYNYNETDIDKQIDQDINIPFDLQKDFPIRVNFYNRINTTYLLINIHHIASDGWSMDILFKEIDAFYYSKNLPILPIQYKDFSVWQREYLQGEILQQQLAYWKEKLRGYEPLVLPINRSRPKEISYAGDDVLFSINESLSEQLRILSKKQGCSMYATLLSGFYILLNKYSFQEDIVLGTPIANRHYSEIQDLIGFFVNSLALRENVDQKKNILEFIFQVQHNLIEAHRHQDLSFEKLVEELKVGKDISRHPIFQVMFSIQSFDDKVKNSLFKSIDLSSNSIAKFDLSCFIDDSKSEIQGTFNFATSLFMKSTIERMVNHYLIVLDQMVNNQEKQIKDYCLLSKDEYQQLVIDWNQTDKEYPKDKTVYQLFEAQVSKEPANIAIIFEEEQLTYAELNVKSNQVARYLQTQTSIKSDTIIGLCLDKGLEMIIGILGILKSGAAYLPIDPEYPSDRIYYLLEDSQTKLVLTQSHLKERLEEITDINLVVLDSNCYENQEAKNLEVQNKTTDLAYVIYTSGSTGKPKGVCVSHESLNNLIFSQKEKLNINNETQVLQFASIIFDASVWEIFSSLAFGAKLNIVSNKTRLSMECLNKYISTQKINLALLPPTILNILPTQNLECLKYLLTGGDNCNDEILAKWNRGRVFINAYGPTESAVCATMHEYKDGDISANIGKALNNIKCYVLDSNKKLVPIGVIGELYISGASLAREYLNKPKLTAEQFIVNSFATEEDILKGYTRLYKTGDLVRWLPEGNLEYVGREDFQVKIRGYRIELGEIENALISIEHIKQAVVLAKRAKSNKYLVAYFVSDIEVKDDYILNQLSIKLPSYMIPSALVRVDSFPLTASGKIDRKALPDPKFTNIDTYVAPRNELEKRVCKVWAEILDLPADKIGIEEDFFRLGGNSILAIRLLGKLNTEVGSNIILSTIFKHNSIKKLSHYLSQNVEDTIIINKSIFIKSEEQILSFAQERLWFIEKYEQGTNAYNVPMIFRLSNKINLEILKSSINSVVARHEILRTLIKESAEGKGYQLVIDEKEYPLEINEINIINHSILDIELSKEINHVYDLSTKYPIRVCIYKMAVDNSINTAQCYLSINIHHIAFDGWSLDILLRDLRAYYKYHLERFQGLDSELSLPELNIQYKDFALWQRNYLSGKKLDEQLNYWKKKLYGYETLNLATDKKRPSQIDYKGSYIHFEIVEDTSRKLRELAKELNVSLYSLLLSGYYLMLGAYSNQDDIVLGAPIANRHYNQIENLIGFFVNVLVLRTKIDSNVSIIEFIQRIGQEVVEAQLHQDLPFERLVEELDVNKDTSRHPIFQVMFTVQSFGGMLYNKENKSTDNIDTDLFNVLHGHQTASSIFNVTKFDTALFIDDSQLQLRGLFNYAVSLYAEETISQYVKTYTNILYQLAMLSKNRLKQGQTKIKNINYLDQKQYDKIMCRWNQTDRVYPDDKTINKLFEEQVEIHLDNIAMVYNEKEISYKTLNKLSNKLANYLIKNQKIKADTLVLLCLDRNEHMLIAILAVLKAGGAYVPIDPSYPDERIQYILKDTGGKVVLTNAVHEERLKKLIKINVNLSDMNANQRKKVLVIDSQEMQEQLLLQADSNPKTVTTSANLAYVIYTSGTTGNPKGVMIEHKSVLNTILSLDKIYDFKKGNKVTAWTSYTFDVSVSEFFVVLCRGGVLHLLSEEVRRDPLLISKYILKNSINYVYLPPVLLSDLPKIKYTTLFGIVYAGEPCNSVTGKYWSTQCNLYNYYGPTEITIYATGTKIIEGNVNLIGSPIYNTVCYVLDRNLNPLPIGAIGELYLGGVGLARGYLNRPELTAEKFIDNPFKTENKKIFGKNEKLYKTGDLVRWTSNGNLEYIGRNDFQIKLRGYRIELGEIESVLSNYKGIKQSIVIVKEHADNNGNKTGNKYLIAYCVKALNLKKTDTEGFINKWETVYESEYLSLDIDNFKQNIKGWNSSYTEKPIDKTDMLEWINATTDRIKELKPKVILEVGSGSGLVLFNVIDGCDYYYATDFSKNVIDYTNDVVRQFGYGNKVSTYVCAANELPYEVFEKTYDTVVMNSVVQYFPNLDYLELVITELISNMKDVGQLFIGDIRDYRLLKCFHYSVLNYKGETTTKEVDYLAKRDNELLVAPEYFICLKNLNKFITHVEVMPKIGKANHEMNNYRYDVILYINKKKESDHNRNSSINIDESQIVKITDFAGYANAQTNSDYFIVKYLNKRIVQDYLEYNKFYNNELAISKSDCDNILSLNEIIEKVEEKGYKLKLLLDIHNPLYLNIIGYKETNGVNLRVCIDFKHNVQKTDLANNPLVSSKLLENKLGKELKSYLSTKLPNYMIPEHYILLEKLPLTINGKLDRKALPEPEFINENSFVAPTTDLEKKLCTLWEEVLNLKKVGVEDDFFKIGGNSILAIRFVSLVNVKLGSQLSIKDVFKFRTLAKLANLIKKSLGCFYYQDYLITEGNINVNEPFDLTNIQQAYLYGRLDNFEMGNVSTHCYSELLFSKIDSYRFEAAVNKLIQRHDALRTINFT